MENDTQGFPTKTVPVERWFVNLEHIVDEGSAIAGWHALVKAQGWSPVGEPRIVANDDIMHNEVSRGVIGRLVKVPGITVAAGVTNAITVPA